MGMHYHIKGGAEQRVMRAMDRRRDQRTAWARTVAQLYWAECWAG